MKAFASEHYKDKINKIFNIWDPIKIAKYSSAEYLAETDEVSDRLTKRTQAETIAKIIYRVFYKNYNNEFTQSKEDCLHIAVMIQAELNKSL